MGADIKALRTRIKSVNSTMHLTKAMGLVASSKIRRAGEAMQRTNAYAQTLADITKVLLSYPECASCAYLSKQDSYDISRTRIIIIAGDRGLAGGYNANIFRTAREFEGAEFIPIGKRACEKFKRPFVSSEKFSAQDAHDLAKQLCADFIAKKFDRLAIISTKYVSVMTQQARVEYILPLEKCDNAEPKSAIFEPDEITILNTAVPEYVAGLITARVRESFASEVAARRMAMDSADKNASAMIDSLELEYNRARQGAITQEITEIVAGSDV